MKNTKRHSAAASTARRPSANDVGASVAPPKSTLPTRRASAPTKPKAPTLATAARGVRHSSTTTATSDPPPAPSTKQRPPPKRAATTNKQALTSASSGVKPRASLVHDAVRRAYHAAGSGSGTHIDPSSEVTECEHLRGELVRVMADHQRQADEIVALRALARSLKEEVEAVQDAAAREAEDAAAHSKRYERTPTGHEFFQLDAHVDALREENAQLRDRVETIEREKRELEEVLDREIPRCELLAVQARAELESTASQLRDEQQENDRLRSEIAYYKARSRSPVRAHRHVATSKQNDASMDVGHDKENDYARSNVHRHREQLPPTAFDESLRESLMSSVASLSMSAASAFSNQLQDDVETLKSELRRLHRSIDASMMSAARSGATRSGGGHRQPSRARGERETKTEEEEKDTT